ncbi:anaphase-promoting complex, cyclosome, subunit 4-domain-containing protein [Scenedesmus sp. NREL 46B-D3]|nr:anaphase-promoting complex, cyclosome, subunit 4-domain-containing protein [Scenedesmus sp. NREL 46B-D3]
MDASDDGDGIHAAPSTAAAGVAAFTITTELALSSDIPIACWCPTMDLCAVVSADGQLHLHRMDWQLLWAVSPEALITAVTWRPDGKEIAAGHANGAISILDVETGDIVSEHKVHYAGISSIIWCDQAATSSHSSSKGSLFSPHQSMQPHQRYKRLFVPPALEPHPPSSTEPLPDPYEICMEAAGPASWPAERPGLSLLAAADVRGRVSLWLQGQVQVAELTALVMPRASVAGGAAEDKNSLQEEEEERYRLLHVVATSQLDQVMTVNQSASGAVVVVSHSLQLLQQHQQPLQQCTALFSQLQGFLQAAVKCVEVAASDWGSAMADFRKRFDVQLKQELADHGSSITAPQQELLLLLATGCCTSPLQSFLAHTLGEAGLRRLARSLDSTASGLHTALLERVMPLLELVLFLLGELRGCVACGGGGRPPTGAWMGLQVSQLQVLELHAAALLLRTEQLRRTLTASACQYRAFFTWLLTAVRQLEGPGAAAGADGGAGADVGSSLAVCQEVLAFLKGQFLHDVIAPELVVRMRHGTVRATSACALVWGCVQGCPAEQACAAKNCGLHMGTGKI